MSGARASPNEASQLLEAALQQMDGIIQGAKFDLPQPGGHLYPHQQVQQHAHATASSGNSSSLSNALRELHVAVLNARNVPDSYEYGSSGALEAKEDLEHARFLARWMRGQQYLRVEAEKDALQRDVVLLTEQLERQATRLRDLEALLAAKKDLLRQTEAALKRERDRDRSDTAAPPPAISSPSTVQRSQIPEQAVVAENTQLKNRCHGLEMENRELRKLVGGDRTPKYLPLSPRQEARSPNIAHLANNNNPTSPISDSSPEELSPTGLLKKEVGFSNRDEDIPNWAGDVNDNNSSFRERPPRGLKKILGKIKRSNSGGHLADIGVGSRSETPSSEFRRGGLRATAGHCSRSGYSVDRSQREFRKPLHEWNVDTICFWLEHLGLGAYCPEIQRNIGTGQQLAKMSFNELETKLNVRHPLHKKKFFLALVARQDTNRPDPEGALDYHWVLRWLDDVGLPQYKETFLEARVDGRVLNVLTVEDLFAMKITNQLHHLSLRRGIQVLRGKNFHPNCLRRRAIPGEVLSPEDVSLWTNHRVMEWLKQVDLSEYAPNLRGSGVHGGLLIYEPRFTDGLVASLLSIPGHKTLLRRHLSIHFKELVGRDIMAEKRAAESDKDQVLLTPTAKAKSGRSAAGQFTLKRKKSKAQFDQEDLLCPFK